ncbi:MAG: hypothetical protein QOE15_724, partial [Acidimicrobiaceae bacterium]|nr:hypothetical protein [Acidimicrobiaceae bacterium]
MKTRGSLTEVSSDQEKVTTAAPEVPPSEVSLAPLTQDATEPPARSQWQLFFRRFRRHRLAIASL